MRRMRFGCGCGFGCGFGDLGGEKPGKGEVEGDAARAGWSEAGTTRRAGAECDANRHLLGKLVCITCYT